MFRLPNSPKKINISAHGATTNFASVSSRNFGDKSPLSYSLDTVAQMNIGEVPDDVVTSYIKKRLRRAESLQEIEKTKKLFEKKLEKYGFTEELEKFKKCCANFSALVCENGHSFRPIVDFRCHLPFCPNCWKTKANRELKDKLPKILQALRNDQSLIVAFMTLTIRSEKKRHLRDGIKKLKTKFRALRRRDVFENCVGGFGRIENTFNPDKGWHPHLHSVVLLKDFVPQKDLSRNWNEITVDSKIVDIRRVGNVASGLVEVIKYPFKPSDLAKLGKTEIAQMLGTRGVRLGVPFGRLFGIEVEESVADEMKTDYSEFIDDSQKLEIGDCCPICATKLDLIDFSARNYKDFLFSVPSTNARGKPN